MAPHATHETCPIPRSSVSADHITGHFELWLKDLDSKAMAVCMSGRICVGLHNENVCLRPGWRHDDEDEIKS
jgi:hypothetical protein